MHPRLLRRRLEVAQTRPTHSAAGVLDDLAAAIEAFELLIEREALNDVDQLTASCRGLLEVVRRLAQLGVVLPEELMTLVATVEDLSRDLSDLL